METGRWLLPSRRAAVLDAAAAAAAAVELAEDESDGVWAAVVTGWECVGM